MPAVIGGPLPEDMLCLCIKRAANRDREVVDTVYGE